MQTRHQSEVGLRLVPGRARTLKDAAQRIIETTRQQWEKTMPILTNEDLKALTGGLVQGAAQCRWITRELGFKPPMKIDGHPSITWEQVNRGRTSGEKPRTEPRWSVAA